MTINQLEPWMRPLFWTRFRKQERYATLRGIPFLLTFDEWIDIWLSSGQLHNRGARKGQYVMARNGDVGPYSVGNVSIVLAEKNASDANVGKCRSKPPSWKGKKHSEETKRKIGDAHRGRKNGPQDPALVAKRVAAMKGRKLSNEHRDKIRAAALRRYSGTRRQLAESSSRISP